MAAPFTGFPPDALAFFTELQANNERTWWLANKARFDAVIKEPMRALLDALTPAFGEFHVFRMNRDVRFSKDKSPYKTAHAAMTETDGGSSLYVQLSATGLLVGSGMYHLERDQLARFRAAVDDDRTGRELEQVLAALRNAKHDVGSGGDGALSTTPRGYAKDHPRIELLRWKGCISMADLGAKSWLHTAKAADRVATFWRTCRPLSDWLDAHVGATTRPPFDRER